jgi:hypothetical protein
VAEQTTIYNIYRDFLSKKHNSNALFGSVVDPRIRAFDQWIQIRILLFSSLTFKAPTKNFFFPKISAYYFLKVHHFSKIKSDKEDTKQ